MQTFARLYTEEAAAKASSQSPSFSSSRSMSISGGGDGVGKRSKKRRGVAPFKRLDHCQDFKWSRKLWGEAASRVATVAVGLLVGYSLLSYWLLTHSDGLTALEGCYFISATVSLYTNARMHARRSMKIPTHLRTIMPNLSERLIDK